MGNSAKKISTVAEEYSEDSSATQQSTAQLKNEIRIRKQAEFVARVQREKLLVTLRSIADGVIATDATGSITLLNPIAEKYTGWSEVQAFNSNLGAVFHVIDEDLGVSHGALVSRLRAGHKLIEGQGFLVAKDGSETFVRYKASPIFSGPDKLDGIVIVFRDISQRRKQQQDMLRRQKLESVGLLAGGIAHDFNNLLTGIMGNISLVNDSEVSADERSQLLQAAEDACRRAKGLTERLLTFAKGGNPRRKLQSILPVLKDAIDFSLAGTGIVADIKVESDLWQLSIDEGQMTQAFNNLLLNAAQAMPTGGVISVTLSNLQLIVGNNYDLKPGSYVSVLIADQGDGIKEEFLSKIFDPYFSTKFDGSGLGLATVYAVIKSHEGYVSAGNVGVENGGAEFKLIIPAKGAAKCIEKKEPMTVKKGSGRVLVLDDEKMIRELSEMMLKRLGYDVVTVVDGEAALAAYKEAYDDGDQFDVVIADLTVNDGMGGKDTANELIKLYGDIKIIVSSGYSKDPVMANYKDYGFCDMIAKPYNLERFSSVLDRVLNS